MDKDASLFSSLSGAPKQKIYVASDYALTIVGNGDVECQHGCLFDVYNVPIMSENLLLVAQLMKTNKTAEFWSDCFIVMNVRCGGETIVSRILDHKDGIYKLCDSRTPGLIAPVTQVDDISQIWHEQLGNLNF